MVISRKMGKIPSMVWKKILDTMKFQMADLMKLMIIQLNLGTLSTFTHKNSLSLACYTHTHTHKLSIYTKSVLAGAEA